MAATAPGAGGGSALWIRGEKEGSHEQSGGKEGAVPLQQTRFSETSRRGSGSGRARWRRGRCVFATGEGCAGAKSLCVDDFADVRAAVSEARGVRACVRRSDEITPRPRCA